MNTATEIMKTVKSFTGYIWWESASAHVVRGLVYYLYFVISLKNVLIASNLNVWRVMHQNNLLRFLVTSWPSSLYVIFIARAFIAYANNLDLLGID